MINSNDKIMYFCSADSEFYHKMMTTNAALHYNGYAWSKVQEFWHNLRFTDTLKNTKYYRRSITWLISTIIKSTCEIDVRYFPFDIQICALKVGDMIARFELSGKNIKYIKE